jgi:hypothetical protein
MSLKKRIGEGFVTTSPFFGTIETNVFTPYINSGSQILLLLMESL